jgi:hypothetical protein
MNKKQGLFGIKDGIYLIIVPLVIILPIGYWYFTAPPPGWCETEKRVLTNKEVIELAGVYTAKQSEQKVVDGKVLPPLNCCSLGRVESTFWSKILRIDKGIDIGWWYERSEEAIKKSDASYKYYHQMITVNSCATKWIWQGGIVEKETGD